MFITTLFLIVKKWKQSKYSPNDEWINKIKFHCGISAQWNISQPYKGMMC